MENPVSPISFVHIFPAFARISLQSLMFSRHSPIFSLDLLTLSFHSLAFSLIRSLYFFIPGKQKWIPVPPRGKYTLKLKK